MRSRIHLVCTTSYFHWPPCSLSGHQEWLCKRYLKFRLFYVSLCVHLWFSFILRISLFICDFRLFYVSLCVHLWFSFILRISLCSSVIFVYFTYLFVHLWFSFILRISLCSSVIFVYFTYLFVHLWFSFILRISLCSSVIFVYFTYLFVWFSFILRISLFICDFRLFYVSLCVHLWFCRWWIVGWMFNPACWSWPFQSILFHSNPLFFVLSTQCLCSTAIICCVTFFLSLTYRCNAFSISITAIL